MSKSGSSWKCAILARKVIIDCPNVILPPDESISFIMKARSFCGKDEVLRPISALPSQKVKVRSMAGSPVHFSPGSRLAAFANMSSPNVGHKVFRSKLKVEEIRAGH